MTNDDQVTISRDSFLEPLGMADLGDGERSREEFDALYALAVEYCGTNDLIVAGAVPGQALSELAWKVPGTAITVRLGGLGDGELKAILGLALFVIASGVPPTALALTPLVAALGRIRKLRTAYGERSVVEVLARAKPADARNVLLALYGKPCLHPDAGCRFLDGESGACGISLEEVEKLLTWLVDEEVLRQLNPTDPIEYRVSL